MGNFYLRRARRILPALILVILASVLAGIFVLTPTEMSRLAQSAMAALAFVSNGYWFFELESYGAPVGLLQPLLHTWSLAIEEQFYLLFPLLLAVLRPTRFPAVASLVLGALILVSLVSAERMTDWLQPMSFYSPTSRAWELLGGALLALCMTAYPRKTAPGPVLRWVVPKLGIVVLGISVVMVELDHVGHPGWVTVPVVLATLGLIWAAQGDEVTTRVLSSMPFVVIGRLSYSIYLWHFPVFAYGRLTTIGPVTALDMAIWLVLTLILSVASYYLIERPFRHGIGQRAFLLSLSGAVIAVTAVFMLGTRTDTLSRFRASQLSALYDGAIFDNEALASQAWEPLNSLAAQTMGPAGPNARRPSDDELQRLWFTDPEALNILVIGNSHSRDMFNALHAVASQRSDIEVARFGMLTMFPETQREALFAAPNFEAADVVMIAPRYNDNGLEAALGSLIEDLQARGKLVVVVGNTAEFDAPARLPLIDYVVRQGPGAPDRSEMNSFAYDAQSPRLAVLNATLRELAETQGAVYLSRNDFFLCSDAAQTCWLRLPDGAKALCDYGHWTLAGANFVADRIIVTDWLTPVFEAAGGRASD